VCLAVKCQRLLGTVFISRLAGNLTGRCRICILCAVQQCGLSCVLYLLQYVPRANPPAGGLGGCNWPMAAPGSSTGLACSSNPSQQASKKRPNSSSFLIVLANLILRLPICSLLHCSTPLPGFPCIARPPKTGVWFASPTTTPFSCGLHAFIPSLSEWRRSQHLGPPGIGPLAPERGGRQVKGSTGHAGINAQRAILPEVSCCFNEDVPSL
jgi:hypothetical protein